MLSLIIFRFGEIATDLIDKIRMDLQHHLRGIYRIIDVYSELLSVPDGYYNQSRHQYLADPVLQMLHTYLGTQQHGLGVVNLDLYTHRLNFIFGIAQPGSAALIALPRLDPRFYGLPQDDELFMARIEKEVNHEIGHVLGLSHCQNYCVMRFSNMLADTDRKPAIYCPQCQHQINRMLGKSFR